MADAGGLPTVVVGTAGHIDHGKTSLVKALTGIDADRLPEEQARGMTIEVGYAHLAFEDGVELDFVDVPGHDRLIGNMLVGAGEIDAAMLVVAADDGPRPQTLEHLQLLDALGISAGLAVVTKIDVVEPARIAEVVAEVATLLAATSLAGVPVLAASSVTGEGIDALTNALREVHDRFAARWVDGSGSDPTPPRLAIDRAFSPKGRGVVVTGTLRGMVARKAWMRREPGGELVRIRELQVHGSPQILHHGGRAAFNITGDVARDLQRGDVLSGAGTGVVRGTDRLLVSLRKIAALVRQPPGNLPVSNLRLHIGTAQVDASLRRIRTGAGSESMGVLTLGQAVATFPGDHAVLREPASGTIVAGARILDLDPPRGASRRRLTAERLKALATAVNDGNPGEVDRARLQLHGAVAVDPATPPRHGFRSMSLADDVDAALVSAAEEAVGTHHRVAPLSAGVPLPRMRAVLARKLRSMVTIERQYADLASAAIARLLDDLVAEGRLARRGDALRDPSLANDLSKDLLASMDRLEAALSVAAPPSLAEAAGAAGCPPEGIHALATHGRIMRLGPDLAWATPTYHRLAALALERARDAPLTPAAYRDATGTSRKFVMAILEDLDRRRILQRTSEGHVPGPRAPRVAPTPAVEPGR